MCCRVHCLDAIRWKSAKKHIIHRLIRSQHNTPSIAVLITITILLFILLILHIIIIIHSFMLHFRIPQRLICHRLRSCFRLFWLAFRASIELRNARLATVVPREFHHLKHTVVQHLLLQHILSRIRRHIHSAHHTLAARAKHALLDLLRALHQFAAALHLQHIAFEFLVRHALLVHLLRHRRKAKLSLSENRLRTHGLHLALMFLLAQPSRVLERRHWIIGTRRQRAPTSHAHCVLAALHIIEFALQRIQVSHGRGMLRALRQRRNLCASLLRRLPHKLHIPNAFLLRITHLLFAPCLLHLRLSLKRSVLGMFRERVFITLLLLILILIVLFVAIQSFNLSPQCFSPLNLLHERAPRANVDFAIATPSQDVLGPRRGVLVPQRQSFLRAFSQQFRHFAFVQFRIDLLQFLQTRRHFMFTRTQSFTKRFRFDFLDAFKVTNLSADLTTHRSHFRRLATHFLNRWFVRRERIVVVECVRI
mmetsp:Transcript_44862/g.74310  ORF Transcript_44862/g.74310 Transcript_44862/m.74310 type:complete len:478 (-) Transcript_44862:23-1456(-)